MNRRIYFLLLVIFAAEAYLLNNRFGYMPLLFLILLLPVDLTCAVCARIKLSGGVPLPGFREYGLGDPVAFSCGFKNGALFLVGRLRISFAVEGPEGFRPMKKKASLSVAPKLQGTLRFSFTPEHIGAYRARVRKAVVYGPMGIFGIRLRAGSSASAVVAPGRSAEENGEPPEKALRREDGSAKGRGRRDEESYDGVREYAPGDPMKSIHWKLSAHSRKMMTRLCEESGEICSTVAVDFRPARVGGAEALCVHDLLCEMAFRELLSRVERGESVRLISCGGNELCTSRVHSEEEISEAAVSLALAGKDQYGLGNEIFPLGNSGAAVVTARLDEGLASELAALAESGAETVYCYAAPPEGGPEDAAAFSKKLAEQGVKFILEKAADPEESAARLQITRE